MPARDPILSPRSFRSGSSVPKSGPNMPASSSQQWTGFYLPETSAIYNNFDDSNVSEADTAQMGPSSPSAAAAGLSQSPAHPRPVVSGSQWLSAATNIQQPSPNRPGFLRRQDSSSSYRSERFSFSDTPEVIRNRTAFLADMPFRRSPSFSGSINAPLRITPLTAISPSTADHGDNSMDSLALSDSEANPSAQSYEIRRAQVQKLSTKPTISSSISQNVSDSSPTPAPPVQLSTTFGKRKESPSVAPSDGSPSGITRMFASRSKSRSPTESPERCQRTTGDGVDERVGRPDAAKYVPAVKVRKPTGGQSDSEGDGANTPTPTQSTTVPAATRSVSGHHTTVDFGTPEAERVPLLADGIGQTYGGYNTGPAATFPVSFPASPFSKKFFGHAISQTGHTLGHWKTYSDVIREGISSLPAVILGLLLNVLDGVSYGFIMFPAGSIFAGFGSLGVSMFFVTTIVSQLVYSLGGSTFAGANGSMMIEVVPFFHILAAGITDFIGENDPEAIISTTMVAFAFSSIITGLSFFALGHYKLGNIIGFFPRHILVGCIGGVGVFLVETGLEVSASINDDDGFQYNWKTLKLFLTNTHVLSLWIPAFALAVLLRVITHRVQHQLVFPIYFLTIPLVFYTVTTILRLDLTTLREHGWVFDVGQQTVPWYRFYQYFNFSKTNFAALMATMPTQLALLFFNILHPPLNVPALAVSLNVDEVDTNRELVAHGISNFLAGCLGTVPNYLVYVNTLMFYRVGGGSRVSGILLAAGTAVLLVVGTGPIGYIPIMLVGALIFVLGIDLIKEAVWDTRHRTTWPEYITIVAIMICMSLWDFVVGVLFGIVLACFFFVVQNSQRRSIRTLYTGASSMSAVRRPSAHREYLREVGRQTVIMRLQGKSFPDALGFLFFGTITYVEETIRKFMDHAQWEQHPIRFLIIDLSLVGGLDMSSAEAFGRIHRLLITKNVTLIFCGIAYESPVADALQSVDLWTDKGENVEVFESLNDAMEWTENAYLRAWFSAPQQQKTERVDNKPIAPQPVEEPPTHDTEEPINTLMKAFSSYSPSLPLSFYTTLAPYLEQFIVPESHTLFSQDDESDGLYFIEHGVLRATYRFVNGQGVEESMVSGTLAGELSALSGMPRNATVVAERQSVLWKLSLEELVRMEREQPEIAKTFTKLVLKAAKIDYDVLLASMATRA
ncbi:hypothetical protein FRB99_008448 [Tulasnella sp. 403]|nr:hypothetical protein FRB99_008448 [Tulasnella sp. 403]